MSEQLDAIALATQQNGVEVTESELRDEVTARADTEADAVSYSWVHLNEFRLFQLHGECFLWTTTDELREAVESVP